MTKFLVTKRPLTGLRSNFEGIGEVIHRFGQIAPLLKRSGVTLFAEPAIGKDGTHVAWYSDFDTAWRPFTNLSEEEQLLARHLLWEQLDLLDRALDQTAAEGKADLQRTIAHASEIPSPDSLFLGKDRVILVEWGFVKDLAGSESGVARRLARRIPPVADTPAPSPASESATRSQLRVRVVAENSRAPVVGCEVRLLQTAPASQLAAGTTDLHGFVNLGTWPSSRPVEVRTDGIAQRYAAASAQFGEGEPPRDVVELVLTPVLSRKPRPWWWLLAALAALLVLLLAAWWFHWRYRDLGLEVLDAVDRQRIAAGRLETDAGERIAEVRDGRLIIPDARRPVSGRVVAEGYQPKPVRIECCDSPAILLDRVAPPPPPPPPPPSPSPPASVPTGDFTVKAIDKATRQPVGAHGNVTMSSLDFGIERRVDLVESQASFEFPASWSGRQVHLYLRAEGYKDGQVRIPCCQDQVVELEKLDQGPSQAGMPGDYEITLSWGTRDDLDLKLLFDSSLQCAISGATVRIVDFGNVRKRIDCQNGDTRYASNLDVDANAEASQTSMQPVEHIYVNKVGSQTTSFRVLVDRYSRSGERKSGPGVSYTIKVREAGGRVLLNQEGVVNYGRPDAYDVSM